MKSTTTPLKRDTGKLIAKNLIILVVLLTVCSLSIWAWFSQNQEATANGISIKAKASGVQVSWDDTDYYDNLTAISKDDTNYATGKTGVAKYITGSDDNPYSLKLVTGNGVDFFEPYLNRRTGEAVVSNGVWQGVTIDKTNSEGKFVDVDLYFRGTSEGNVWLHKNSTVSPTSTKPTDRTSDYGGFTRDYIAAASRVAFLDVTETESNGVTTETEDCKFIWAPNANIHLEEGDGYTIVDDYDFVTVSGGTTTDLDGKAEKDPNKTFYFWTIAPDVIYQGGDTRNVSDYYMFTYNETTHYYETTFSIKVPSDSDSPSVPFVITYVNDGASENPAYNPLKDSGYKPLDYLNTVQRQPSFNGNSGDSVIKISNMGYNSVTFGTTELSEAQCNQLYFSSVSNSASNTTLQQGTVVEITFGFNPTTGVVTVLGYDGNVDYSKGGVITEEGKTYYYYLLENGTNCALVNSQNSVALSIVESYMKDVKFKDALKATVTPISISRAEQFTVERDTEGKEVYEYTYKFKNNKTNTYLAINNGVVSIDSASGSDFTLEYKEGVTGPLLKTSDGYYLVFHNGNMKGVTESELDTATLLTVYTGDAYKINTKYDVTTETYKYYKAGVGEVVLNSSSTEYPLYSSPKPSSDTTDTIGIQIAKLTKKSEDAEYYTAHIRMRIWVEGTDAEALLPLADGRFNLNLHFTNVPPDKTE